MLPSKQEMKTLASDLKMAWRHDLHIVKSDSVTDLWASQNLWTSGIIFCTSLSTNCSCQSSWRLGERNRRKNIRIQGLPETVRTQDLFATLMKVFNALLGKPEDTHIEIDRAHRALQPQSQDSSRPRDVICQIQLYSVKETIMHKAQLSSDISFEGFKITCSQTYANVPFDWEPLFVLSWLFFNLRTFHTDGVFPFAHQVYYQDSTATFRSPSDLPSFLKTLGLLDIDLHN